MLSALFLAFLLQFPALTEASECADNILRTQYGSICENSSDPKLRQICIQHYLDVFTPFGEFRSSPETSLQPIRPIAIHRQTLVPQRRFDETFALGLPLWALAWGFELAGGKIVFQRGIQWALTKWLRRKIATSKLKKDALKKGVPLFLAGWATFFLGGRHFLKDLNTQWVCENKELTDEERQRCNKEGRFPKKLREQIKTALQSSPTKESLEQNPWLCEVFSLSAKKLKKRMDQVKCLDSHSIRIGSNDYQIQPHQKLLVSRNKSWFARSYNWENGHSQGFPSFSSDETSIQMAIGKIVSCRNNGHAQSLTKSQLESKSTFF